MVTVSRRRPPPEPADDRLKQLHEQLWSAEDSVLRWCSVECHHPILSRNPPPCGHPDELLCGMAQRRVASLRKMIAEEEAKRAS